MEKKHGISCNVNSCFYNANRGCNAQNIEVCLNNSSIASDLHETACRTFKTKQVL